MTTMARRLALAAALDERVEAFLVTNLVNVRYLSGFTGSNATLVVSRDGSAVLTTDGRYETQAASESPDVEIIVARAAAPAALATVVGRGARRIAVERQHVTLAAYDVLRAAAPDVEFEDGRRAVEHLRVRKDESELATIAEACRITDAVFAAVLPSLRPGVTERVVAWLMVAEMQQRGAGPAFDSIVAFGPDSARPHHRPTDRPLERGDLVTMDFGAKVDGYHADMTRTVVLGPPAAWQQEVHALVREVQRDARTATRTGSLPAELDADVRRRIEAAGHRVAHGLGHGVGLEIHESPFLVAESDADRLVERVPVTIEPGVYLPGRGGVRIEDTVVVRAGGVEPLTTSTRDLIEI